MVNAFSSSIFNFYYCTVKPCLLVNLQEGHTQCACKASRKVSSHTPISGQTSSKGILWSRPLERLLNHYFSLFISQLYNAFFPYPQNSVKIAFLKWYIIFCFIFDVQLMDCVKCYIIFHVFMYICRQISSSKNQPN